MTEPTIKRLGRYEIVRELGKGAMGVVYEGRDPLLGRRVAIKTARRDLLELAGRVDELMERFLREASAAGSLNHPNIVTIFDAAEEDGVAYIAMEYLDGINLEHHLAIHRRIDPEQAVDWCATICCALDEAHRAGIIHRDIKPANIIITPAGPKLADFGVARIGNSNLTQEGAMIGTPFYMSPEQFQGGHVDGRSDLFSLAVILYEMLTGEKPFQGEAIPTVMTAVLRSDPIEPSELNVEVNGTLSRVILKALEKRRGKRYANGSEMATALRESLRAHPDPEITRIEEPEAESAVVGIPIEVQSNAALERTVVGIPPALNSQSIIELPNDPGITARLHPPYPPGDSVLIQPPTTWVRTLSLATAAAALLILAAATALAVLQGSKVENGWDTFTLTVKLADNQVRYDEYIDTKNSANLPPAKNARVRILDPDKESKPEIRSGLTDDDGKFSVKLGGIYTKLIYQIDGLDDFVPEPMTLVFPPDGTSEWKGEHVLTRRDIDY